MYHADVFISGADMLKNPYTHELNPSLILKLLKHEIPSMVLLIPNIKLSRERFLYDMKWFSHALHRYGVDLTIIFNSQLIKIVGMIAQSAGEHNPHLNVIYKVPGLRPVRSGDSQIAQTEQDSSQDIEKKSDKDDNTEQQGKEDKTWIRLQHQSAITPSYRRFK